jgi:multiple sugar transport system ATP-binding protein
MSKVVLQHIRKEYPGGVLAVEDFCLEISDEEFVILVGPSGCGKSTTLRMIAGLETISDGVLTIDERMVNDVPPKDRDIAMVFQNYALYPHMTVYDNMAFGIKMRKVAKDEIKRRVDEAAQILDITHLLNRKPSALSGGQRQRVALGRAIVRRPQVFLLDEPLSNLDAKLRGQMRTELSGLHKELQATFVYVTHDQMEAMTMADRIVVMNNGMIQQIDTPQNIYEKPLNLFVAGFIGAPQMNFVRAIVLDAETLHIKIGFGAGTDATQPFTLKIPRMDYRNDSIRRYVGGEVVLGIRPEHIGEETLFSEGSAGAVIGMTVELAEPVGAETFLHLATGETKLTARVTPYTTLRRGETINVAFDVHKIHIFDPKSEERLTF